MWKADTDLGSSGMSGVCTVSRFISVRMREYCACTRRLTWPRIASFAPSILQKPSWHKPPRDTPPSPRFHVREKVLIISADLSRLTKIRTS